MDTNLDGEGNAGAYLVYARIAAVSEGAHEVRPDKEQPFAGCFLFMPRWC